MYIGYNIFIKSYLFNLGLYFLMNSASFIILGLKLLKPSQVLLGETKSSGIPLSLLSLSGPG